MKPVLVIRNPMSAGAHLWPKVERALLERDVAFEMQCTKESGHAVTLACEAAEDRRLIVAAGGDGHAQQVANGLLAASEEKETTPMAILPLGGGNDAFYNLFMARRGDAGRKAFSWQDAVDMIVTGKPEVFDVGQVVVPGAKPSVRYFLNSCGIGFGAKGALNYQTIRRFKLVRGWLGYLAAGIWTLFNYPQLNVRWRADGGRAMAQATSYLALQNGPRFGGVYFPAPAATAFDGLLDAVIADRVSLRQIVLLLGRMLRRMRKDNPSERSKLRTEQVRSMEIEADADATFLVELDGELPFGEVRKIEVSVVRALRVLSPVISTGISSKGNGASYA